MSNKCTGALTALLILGVTSLGHAQQSADTAKRDADGDRDKQALTTDTIKLHRDIALKDSAQAMLLRDRTQTQTDEKQLDSLRAMLKHDRQASPRDTAAIAKDQAAVTSLEKKVKMDRDQTRREETRLDLAQKAVRRESHAAFEEHRDIHSDAVDTDRARDRDQQALATDTMKLHHDIVLKDSVRAMLLRDRTQTQSDEKQLDSMRAMLKHDRQASPRDTAAIAKDQAAVTSLEKKVEMDRDQAQREETRLDLAQKAVRRESHAAFEEHRDIREDKPRSQEPEPTRKTRHG
jgi:hypothetical protein